MNPNPSWRKLHLICLRSVALGWMLFGAVAIAIMLWAWWGEGGLAITSEGSFSYVLGLAFCAACIWAARKLLRTHGELGRGFLIGLSVLGLLYCFTYLGMVGAAWGVAWLGAAWGLSIYAMISLIILAFPSPKSPGIR